MLDIPDIAFYSAFHLREFLCLAAESRHLAPSCDARLDEVADHVFIDELGVFRCVLEHVRTRAHNAHVALKHIPELRQFVDVRLAHYISPFGLARVVLRCLQFVGIGVDLHAAELVAVEFLAVQSVALLAEEHRSRHGQLRHYRHDDQYYREQGAQERGRHEYVEEALDEAVLGMRQ